MIRLLALALLLLACGADVVEHDVDLGEDVVHGEEGFLGTFEYGTVPPDVAASMAPEQLEKWLAHFELYQSIPTLRGESVLIPTFFGTKFPGSSRCLSNPDTWTEHCLVPWDRSDTIGIDEATCDAISGTLTDSIFDGYNRIKNAADNVFGWSINYASYANATMKITCSTDTTKVGGHSEINKWFCWDIPGKPKDVCFQMHTTKVVIDLAGIKSNYGTTNAGRILTDNITYHEILHCLGFGHFPTGVMDGGLSSSALEWLSTDQDAMLRHYWHRPLHDQQPVHACNWLMGDAPGDSCPHHSVW